MKTYDKLLTLIAVHGEESELAKLSLHVLELYGCIKDPTARVRDITKEIAHINVLLREIMLYNNIDDTEVEKHMRSIIDDKISEIQS